MRDTKFLDLQRDIIHKRAGKKVLFQPRILSWYEDRIFSKIDLPGKYKGSSSIELYEKLGCSNRLYDFGRCLKTRLDPSVRVEKEQISELELIRRYITPVGTVYERVVSNTSNYGQMPSKWFIETAEDLRVYSYIEETMQYSFNREIYNELYARLSHLGMPTVILPRTSIQKLIVELSGVENTFYLLADHPNAVEDFFRALSRGQERMLRVMADSPIECINYGDNLHCRILPDYMYAKYILPEYEKRGDILHKAGKFVHSHWDGDVRGYLKYAKSSFLDGIEAITPIPQGDVTIEEVKAALGDETVLLDGIAALLFSDTFPFSQLKEAVAKTIELFAGQLILGISDEMPSNGNIERVERVNEMVNEYNAKL